MSKPLTIEEAKDNVAKKNGCSKWGVLIEVVCSDMSGNIVEDRINKYIDEVILLYSTSQKEEGEKQKEQVLNNLLNDTEEFLRHLEDFTHGKDGDTITELRHRINKFKK